MRTIRRPHVQLVLSLSAALMGYTAITPTAFAQNVRTAQGDQNPVALQADEVTHDRTLDIVTARGNVEINQAGQTLYANTVSYNVNQDMVTASGNVSLVSATGEVVFADHMTLSGSMKQGALDNLLLVSADHSRTIARKGRRYIGTKGQQVNALDNAAYTACDSCTADGTPLWQIKAYHITHDEAEKVVEYDHAFLELFGIPVGYTPYLFHADPTVKRRSGLLFPSYGSSSYLGMFYRHPYYWVTSPHSDVTITPILTSDAPSVLAVEYRQNLEDAQFVMDFSGRAGGNDSGENNPNDDSSNAERGHLNFKGQWHINNTWRAKADLHMVSDDDYLDRYKLPGHMDYQTNTLDLEAFAGDDYAKIGMVSFREMRTLNSPPSNPIAAPNMEWTHLSQPGRKGGYWTTSLSLGSILRTDGDDPESTRVSAHTAWALPYVAPSGEHYTLTTSLRGDAYNVRNYTKDDGSEFSGNTGRIIPEVSMRWSWPFSNAGASTTQVIEPVIIASASPYGGNPDDIPNEDSQDFELNVADALRSNHYMGYDRVETGPRVAYGLNWSAYDNASGSRMSATLAQTYRTHGDKIHPESRGLKRGLSDIVGSISYDHSNLFDAEYRFRLDQNNFNFVSNDITASGGTDMLRLGVSYLNLRDEDDLSNDRVEDVEQISFSASSKLTKFWSIYGATNYSISSDDNDKGPLSMSSYAQYEDECFTFRLKASKDFTTDANDDDSGLTVMMTLVFKPLGEANYNF